MSDQEQIIKRLFDEIAEEKALLKSLVKSFGGNGEDILLQYPDFKNMYLDAGEEFEQEIEINRTLYYMALDMPEGVLMNIYKNGMPWMYAIDEIGAIELKGGVHFETIKIKVQNTSEITQKWNLKIAFI